MPTLTAYEEFKDAKPLVDVAPEAGCSVDQLHDLWNAGFLRGITKTGRRHTTVQHVYEAWRKRAEAELERRGVPPRRERQTKSKQGRKERLNALAMATFGVPAGDGK